MKSAPFEFTPGNLPPGSPLRYLVETAEAHQRLERMVLDCLPDNLRAHCRFAAFEDGSLCLLVDSSVQATRLRFAQGEILRQLREKEPFRFAWRLKVKVSPRRRRHSLPRRRLQLSKENARLLKEEAGHTKDQGLRAVLDRLARHGSD